MEAGRRNGGGADGGDAGFLGGGCMRKGGVLEMEKSGGAEGMEEGVLER